MLKNLVQLDVVGIVGESLQSQGWYIDTTSNKYSCAGRTFHSTDKPWIYTNPIPGHPCSVYQTIVNHANFIPTPCLNCWKIVVKPFTLLELVRLWEAQKEFTKDCMGENRFCKCGIEVRKWVPQNYGGYFYTNSRAQGLRRWAQVRELVDKINPAIPVVLKRYCTEFEIKLGPSDKYQWAPGTEHLEQAIFNAVDFTTLGKPQLQPDYLVGHVLRRWIEFAWDRADPTAVLFNDGEPLYTPSVTYHPEGEKK